MSARLNQRLRQMSATRFENLVFDLLSLHGLQNATWRTPGADAGRDIEGTFPGHDMSGAFFLQKWYVECKRYASSVSWPEVHSKIAYAHNHKADFLLICTTAALSPRCKEEITKYNATTDRARVRYWDGPALDQRVAGHPELLVKYGFSSDVKDVSVGVMSLVRYAMKSAHAASGRPAASNPLYELDLCSALLELVMANIDGVHQKVDFLSRGFNPDRDAYEWCQADGSALRPFSAHALRCILAAVRFSSKTPRVVVTASKGRDTSIEIMPASVDSTVLDEIVRLAAMWSNFHARRKAEKIIVTLRSQVSNGKRKAA